MPMTFGNCRLNSGSSVISKPVEKNPATVDNNFAVFDKTLAIQNKAFINFKRYDGDQQPLKRLFWLATGRNEIHEDNWTHERIYTAGNKKWVNAHPKELLKRTLEQTLQSALTLTKPNNQYPGIPSYIPSPDFGDKWGRHANYIEINPRIVAKYQGGEVSEGLLGVMKLLPAIPPSPGKFANCLVLSQLYPTRGNDGWVDDSGLYAVNLHRSHPTPISKTLLAHGLNMKPEEQVKAFNDLAHLMGFKTAFRMPLSAGQMSVNGEPFDWNKHEQAFTDACIWGIELGFDGIYFDSGKHIIDRNGYCGIGSLPSPHQMSNITSNIRKTDTINRIPVSFIGEKAYDNIQGYQSLGFTAGTDWGKADDFQSVLWETQKQKHSREYAAGPEVSNDNDRGEISYEQRLHRLKSNLYAYDHIDNKLPTFMQLHDLFPLSPYTNTHRIMEHPHQMKGSDAWTECEQHWDGIFADNHASHWHTDAVYNEFAHSMRYAV